MGNVQVLRRLINNSKGDTIIEVLFAIIIVGSVLAASFNTIRHSMNNSRQSQERGEALKYVETQLEYLKTASVKPTSNIYTFGTSFCLDSTIVALATTNPACNPPAIAGGTFAVKIDLSGASTFTISADWSKAGGGNDNITMSYRLPQ